MINYVCTATKVSKVSDKQDVNRRLGSSCGVNSNAGRSCQQNVLDVK